MSDVPDHWRAYARLQEKLARSHWVDHSTWGLEAGLNSLLAGEFPVEEDVDRVISSGSRKERHRARLRRVYLVDEGSAENPDAALDARRRLRLVATRVTKDDRRLLRAVGEGYEYGEIAAASHVAPGTLRARVLRLRRRLVALAS